MSSCRFRFIEEFHYSINGFRYSLRQKAVILERILRWNLFFAHPQRRFTVRIVFAPRDLVPHEAIEMQRQ